jgi:exosortase
MAETLVADDSRTAEAVVRDQGSGRRSKLDDRRWVAATCVLLLAAYWPTILSFPPTWSASYNEHGFLLGALVVWLLWRDRDRMFRLSGTPMSDLLPVVGLLSIVWLFAVIMSVQVVHQGLFVMLATAWAFAVFGSGVRVPVLSMAATLSLAIPVWGLIVPILQRATVLASGGATRLAGITAVIGYDTIAIRSGTFLVEEGCAGLNYLMGAVALGAFYALIFSRRWQTQLKIVALAAAMSIVGNWIRVTVLIFLGEATAMQSPYIEDHLWQGWAIFTLLMIPTYFLARRIEIRDDRRFSSMAETADGDDAVRELPSVPHGGVAMTARAATVATAAALVGPILYMAVGALPRGGEVEQDAGVFDIHDAWVTAPVEAGPEPTWTPDFKGIDGRAAWLVSVDGHPVEAARYYFLDQRPGEELIQYNNFVAPDSLLVSERVFGPVGPDRRIVREAILWESDVPRITWYWYRVAGFDTPFENKAKLLEIVAFFRRSPAAELVTLSVRCAPESCTDAARALRATVGGPTVFDEAELDP